MNKTTFLLGFICAGVILLCSSCTTMSHADRRAYQILSRNGITTSKPAGEYSAPNHPAIAGALNLLPGIGNFYLSMGAGNDASQAVYGCINLLLWPISIIWGAPQAAIDANLLNRQDMVYFYLYDPEGIEIMQEKGIELRK